MAELPASVQQAKEAAQSALSAYGTTASIEPTISDVLRNKIQEAYSSNQDIVKPLDTATTEYLSAPSVAREKYQNVFNPFSREKLVSQYQGTTALPMLMYSNLFANRIGRVEDITNAGVNAYKADLLAKQYASQAAQQNYENAINEYKLTQPSYEWLDLGNKKVQVDENGNIINEYAVGASPSSSGGLSAEDILTIVKGLSPDSVNTQPTEPKPDTNMKGKNKKVTWHSPLGQWVYDFQTEDWVPVTL